MNDSKERILYGLCRKMGELCEGKLHIIYNAENIYSDEGYRVYHRYGFCFDIKRSRNEHGGGFQYNYYNEWQHFEKLTVERAIELMRNPDLEVFKK